MTVQFQEETIQPGLHKVRVEGTLDAPGTMTIENPFRDNVLALGGAVVVDLGGVDYMSSYGLRMFLVTAKAMMNSGGTLHLAGANENVLQIIRIAGYDTMFPVYETVEEALHYLMRAQ